MALLATLAPAQWSAAVGPAFPNWTVQDLAAHLAASEALLAELLGAPTFTPEVADQPTPRAHAAVERHRSLSPSQTVAELETAYSLVQAAAFDLGDAAGTHALAWFGLELTLGDVLVQRAFEIWTHADDIRRSLQLPLLPPPAPSLATMSATAVETVPFLLAATGVPAEGRTARLTLTLDGAAWRRLRHRPEPRSEPRRRLRCQPRRHPRRVPRAGRGRLLPQPGRPAPRRPVALPRHRRPPAGRGAGFRPARLGRPLTDPPGASCQHRDPQTVAGLTGSTIEVNRSAPPGRGRAGPPGRPGSAAPPRPRAGDRPPGAPPACRRR